MATCRYEISILVLKKIYFLTLKEKFHILARPCNILYKLLLIDKRSMPVLSIIFFKPIFFILYLIQMYSKSKACQQPLIFVNYITCCNRRLFLFHLLQASWRTYDWWHKKVPFSFNFSRSRILCWWGLWWHHLCLPTVTWQSTTGCPTVESTSKLSCTNW